MERTLITLADQELANRIESRPHFLKEVDNRLNWNRIRKILNKVELRRNSAGGRDAFSAEVMFRIMLLQAWYGLSDYLAEEQLYFNTIFMWFCRLSIENPVPDHSTMCRWRQRFSEKGIYELLFKEINKQLFKEGIDISNGVIVDAALVEAHSRPRKKEIIETEPVGDEEIADTPVYQATELVVEESKDPDARWLKKGKKSIYGYKGHTAADKEHGAILDIEVTPADEFDGNMLGTLVKSMELQSGTEVLADKGYCSQANEDLLEEHGLISRIMRKKKKNRDMDRETKAFNYEVSQDRYRVERTFGALKKHFGWSRSIYVGLEKTKDYLLLRAIAFNTKRSLKIVPI